MDGLVVVVGNVAGLRPDSVGMVVVGIAAAGYALVVVEEGEAFVLDVV